MIIIPELETVVILVPRTGSGTLKRAIPQRYPRAFQLYRHMEADGVPLGYDRWRRVGVVRHPVARLWSLYKFLQDFGLKGYDPQASTRRDDTLYQAKMRASVQRPFSDWIVNNEVVFTSPYDQVKCGDYFPAFTVRHAIPENRKSQFVYLRPDLGTQVYPFEELGLLAHDLDLDISRRRNVTDERDWPDLDAPAIDHVNRFFEWDISAGLRSAMLKVA